MKAKVLVVEDSREQRRQLVELLETRGYEVSAVAGGVDALKAIKASPPDVVILDVILDDLDGYSVCRWLRLSDTLRDIVVIMLTIRGEVKERIEGLHVGADDYVPKPYDPGELEARIYAALRSRNMKRELRQRNAELEGMLTRTEQLAMTDAVTGIFNRRRFQDVLKREWATARRYKHPLSCVLVDVDHFKKVNDSKGHAAGDETLRRVAELISGSIREVDVCARYGGDEFALLLPHTPLDKGTLVMERIRQKLVANRAAWGNGAEEVSLSVGISSTEDASLKNADELLEAADRALYEAKRQGRDRVVPARFGSSPI